MLVRKSEFLSALLLTIKMVRRRPRKPPIRQSVIITLPWHIVYRKDKCRLIFKDGVEYNAPYGSKGHNHRQETVASYDIIEAWLEKEIFYVVGVNPQRGECILQCPKGRGYADDNFLLSPLFLGEK